MVNVAEITGMEFASLNEAAAYYEVKSARIPDAPEFSDAVLPWLRYLDNAVEGEGWDSLVRRVSAEHKIAHRAGDLFSALYPDDESDRYKTIFITEEVEQANFDTALLKAQPNFSALNDDPLVAEVMERMVELAPMWCSIPVLHDQNTADYIWSRMRCLIAGAGYNNHGLLTKILCSKYPNCPFLDDETQEQWHKALVEAHKNSGYPIHLAHVRWKDAQSCFSHVSSDGFFPEEWQKFLALLHIIKHVRMSDTKPDTMISTYEGTAAYYEMPGATLMGQSRQIMAEIVKNLGIASSKGAVANPLAMAFKTATNSMALNKLLRRRALASLSGLVLCGSWSTLDPDPSAMEGFIQHGFRLQDVWLAQNGRVEKTHGESANILGYDWNIQDAAHAKHYEVRRNLETIIPETYEAGFASDLFFQAFPNAQTEGYDRDVLMCLFDAPLIASLIRPEMPLFNREFPIVTFLPSNPTLDDSTNQGKSLAALVYTRIMQPGITRITQALDSGSAPDIRAIADMLRTHGTVCLDEFRVPKAANHPLSSANLFALSTGGSIPIGKVLGNTADSVILQHSLVVAAKAMDVGPDTMNRVVSFYLAPLTNEQRSNGKMIDQLESGALSLKARLGLIALIQEHDIIGQVSARVNGSSNEMRFRGHRTIAQILYKIRTGLDDTGVIDKTVASLQARFAEHIQEADDSGVLSMMEDGRSLRVRLSSIFTDLSVAEVSTMADHMASKALAERQGYKATTVTELLQARLNIAGLFGKPFSDLLVFLSGSRIRTGNRQVSIALSREIRNTVYHAQGWRLPGHLGLAGWHLFRFDNGTSQLVALVNVNAAEAVSPKA